MISQHVSKWVRCKLWRAFFASFSVISCPVNSYDSLVDLSLSDLLKVKVTTASKRSELTEDAPALVYVISDSDIRNRGYAVLSDVLRDLPGFDTTEYGRAEFGTEISVRGIAGNNKTILLVDGVRVNSPGNEPLQVRSDISVRHAKRIEIVYGAGSTLYGQDAINAVINIITKDSSDQRGFEASLSVGEHAYKEAFLSYANEYSLADGGLVKLSGYVQWLDSDLSALNEEYPAWWQTLYSDTIAQDQGGDPAIRWDKGVNINFNIEAPNSAMRLWYRKSSRSSSDGATNRGIYNDLASWQDDKFVLNFSRLDGLSDHLFLHSAITYKRVEVDPQSRFVIIRTDGQSYFSNRKYALATGSTWEERLEFVGEKLMLTGGLIWENHSTLVKVTVPEGEFDSNGNVVLQAGEFSYYTVAGDPESLVVEARATELHYQNYGVYVEGNYQLLNDLSVVFGVRKDWDENTGESPLSLRFSGIYKFLQGFTAKYIYTEAFTSAAPYFAYVNFSTPDAIVTNNPNLEPEESQSHEINVSWQNYYGLVGASIYNNNQSNLIQESREGFSFNTLLDVVYLDEEGLVPRSLIASANGGESTANGVDLYSRYSLGNNSTIWASYSYVDYEAKTEGLVRGLQNLSRENIRLGLTYKLPKSIWLTPSLMYRSTPENFQSLRSLDEEVNNPYWLNFFVRYKPTVNMSAFLRVDNLTDRKIALKGSGGPLPQEVRTVRIGLEYAF